MMKKVLIAEDHQSANVSLQKTLEANGIATTDNVYYCDDALLKVQKSLQDNLPYDLLITDLHFEADQQPQKLQGGTALIEAARRLQPDLKVLVFSATSDATTIEMLFNKLQIDGYVRKARNDVRELQFAMESIANNQRYFPRHLIQLVKKKNTHDFSDFDVAVISLLAEGIRQKDIPDNLKQRKISPSGLSSVEKRLNHIKEVLEFSTNEQLVAFCKDMGII